jgi:hypothetical protein
MKFYFACTFLGGRDVIEEYVSAKIWPLYIYHGWKPVKIVYLYVGKTTSNVPFSWFALRLPKGMSLEDFISEVEKKVSDMVEEFTPGFTKPLQ